MNSKLLQHFSKRVSLTEAEMEEIASLIQPVVYPKKTILLEEGAICKKLSYIVSGCVRVFTIDDDGIENNVFFALEDWWAIDLKSFIEQSSARFYIETLEVTEFLEIPKADFELLLERIPKLEKWFRILLQNALIASENRISYKSTLKAEDRYLKFLDKYPTLESRISQKHIASYLGISPEFLSSMKAKIMKNRKS